MHYLSRLMIVASLGLFLQALPVAKAQLSVTCVNCGTEWTQLANKLAMAKQLATQAQQLQSQLNSYQNMLMNSKTVPTQIWGNVMRDIGQVNTLIQKSKALSGTASDLDDQFANRYGTYNSYLSKKMSNSDWKIKYNQWSAETSDSARYALKAIGIQSTQMASEDALMRQLQSLNPQGQMEALQIGNMMASQSVEQVQKLRQLMMLQLQMQAQYIATQQDKEAAEVSATRKFLQHKDRKIGDGERF